jgi:hypothetical protein
MVDEMMIGFLGRVALVRTRHNLFYARITGEWVDRKYHLRGPVVTTEGGRSFEIDFCRIVCFDDGEIPFREEEA